MMGLKIQNVSLTYSNGVRALQDISLDIPVGVYGILGPNGAGKSTLIRCLATLQVPDTGRIYFNDSDLIKDKKTIRKNLGYLPQEFGVYKRTSAEGLLDYLTMLKGIHNKKARKKIVHFLLELTNLKEVRKNAVSTFSGGMRKRFGIAQALIGNPSLIIVDEPTSGLDPEERVRFHNILSEIGKSVTLILSTHIVEDVSELCPKFAIIKEGKILVDLNTDKALKSLEHKIWVKHLNKKEIETFKPPPLLLSTKYRQGRLLGRFFSNTPLSEDYHKSQPQLEDFYFSTTKGFITF